MTIVRRRAGAACLALVVMGVAVQGAAAASAVSEATPARMTLGELRARYQAPGDRYIDIGGVEVRYRDEGEGPPLLLLHGSSSTLNAWDGVVARLKGRYRIIRFDQPPSGLSGSVSDQALHAVGAPEALVARLLDRLGVAKASVFGTSSGGTLAYYFAATYPDRVDALILSNTPSDSVADAKIQTTPALDAAVDRAKRLGVRDRAYWRTYLSYLYGDPSRLTAATIDYYYATNLRVTEPNPFGLYALTANKQTTMERLRAVKAPVLILWGMRDPVLTPPAEAALYGYLVNAASRSVVALDSVGHFPPLESPERVADLVDAYLQRDR